MKDQVHIMVDIETLGRQKGATVFQVAAASFHIDGTILDRIDLKLDVSKTKLAVEGDTLKWWLETDALLLARLIQEGDLSEREMFEQFFSWVERQGSYKDVTLWGNGILFDNAKLKEKAEDFDIQYPIFYRNDRDVRTILTLASSRSGIPEQDIVERTRTSGETIHDAADDVLFQIRLVAGCYRMIHGYSVEHDGVSREELFDGWKQELGYDRALLLSTGNPVHYVLSLSDEEARTEVKGLELA